MEGEFSKYLEDVYSAEPVARESLTDECEIVVVGAGFAGLLLWYKLRQEGFDDVRFCEKGGDVGGTWYWNRYPGHRLRRGVLQLLPAVRGDGVLPDDEVRLGLRDPRVLPEDGAEVRVLRSLPVPHDGAEDRVGRGDGAVDRVTPTAATRCGPATSILANGILTSPKLARIKGMESFKGETFHTSRWNYNVTGRASGSASSAPVPPPCRPFRSWPRSSSELYVFQRTPSTIDVRDQRATTQEEIETWSKEPGWAEGAAGPVRPASPPAAPRSRPTTTTSPARCRTSRNASSTSGGCRPRS